MVKVTGGGRGVAAIGAHLRYISRRGELEFEDDRGVVREGKEALHDLAEQWRYGGSFIDETSHRREAFNIMLSMKSGTDPMIVQRAAREFAQAELAGHRYVMVLHDHQANPYVHFRVRAESREGRRLNPRKADLQRWRETFAEKLRGWGIDAEATRQRTRGEVRTLVSYTVSAKAVVDFRRGYDPTAWSPLWEEFYCDRREQRGAVGLHRRAAGQARCCRPPGFAVLESGGKLLAHRFVSRQASPHGDTSHHQHPTPARPR